MIPCDVVLLVPPNASLVRGASSKAGVGFIPPLGPGYLAAVLEQAGYRVEIVDMDVLSWRRTELAHYIREQQPRVVGLSLMVGSYNNGLRAAEIIRHECPTAKIVAGGPQATFLVHETLIHPAIDAVVRHEGEETLLELVHHWTGTANHLSDIRGIAYRDGDQVRLTEARPLIADLDRLPHPARHLFKMECYSNPGVLITGRGCVGHCIFCASRAMYPRPAYRSRSAAAVVAEIAELIEHYHLREFFIADDAFTLNPRRAAEICDLMIARQLKARWSCEARVNSMTPDLVQRLRAAGCHRIFYGVETGNADIMKLIRKGIRLDQVKEVVSFTQAAGLDVICSFIIGFPWDTRKTVQETIAFADKLRRCGSATPNRGGTGRGFVTAAFYHLTPLPGTYLYEHAADLGLRFLSQNWDHFTMAAPIIETSQLTVSDLRELRLEATRTTTQAYDTVRQGEAVC